ncbi:MAG: hypothetical protein KAG66_19620 [Methylococcales bacterium]|nr:hypothetical protein [Methylococcales bacterium]
MSNAARLLAASFALLVCMPLFAQDLFKSTGTSTRSYNYIEAQYLFELDIDVPFLATFSIDIDESLSITAEYFTISQILTFNGEDFDVDASTAIVGLLYHRPLSRQRNIDWFAAMSVGREEAMVSAGGQTLKDTTPKHVGLVGLRQSISARLEAEAAVRVQQVVSTDVSVEFKVVYRVAGNFDIALGARDVSDADLLGIGLRYTW